MDSERLHDRDRIKNSRGAGTPGAVSIEVGAVRIGKAIRETPLPPGEVAGAKERVGVMLAATMIEPLPLRPGLGPGRWRRAPRRNALLQGFVAAAALMALITLAVGLSRVSAAALPSSPLYALKRAEEWGALNTAWSDQRRGDVLVVMARRRLDEAVREAAAGHGHLAHSLVLEYQSHVVAIANLMGHMARQQEDAHTLGAQLASVLSAQQNDLQAALQSGDPEFIEALRAAERSSQAAVDANHILLPAPVPGFHSGNAPVGAPASNGTSTPAHTPVASPIPNSTGTPGTQRDGSSGHQDQGDQGGNGGIVRPGATSGHGGSGKIGAVDPRVQSDITAAPVTWRSAGTSTPSGNSADIKTPAHRIGAAACPDQLDGATLPQHSHRPRKRSGSTSARASSTSQPTPTHINMSSRRS